MTEDRNTVEVLERLFEVIKSRRGADASSSYTASLLAGGTDKIAQKLGEEAVETIIAAIAETPERVSSESAAFSGSELEIVNLVYPIDGDDLCNPNVVKAIITNTSKISFFTRTHVPNRSDNTMRQLGMIGFTLAALTQYTNLQPTPIEELESIDMMRLLENDYEINAVISSSPILGVDNPEDIAKAEFMMAKDILLEIYQDKYLKLAQ